MIAKKYFILFTLIFTFIAPSFAAKQEKKVLNIEHWTTKNGAHVYFVKSAQLPMIDIKVIFSAGSSRDGNQPGIAQLTNAMLNQGTNQNDVNSIASGFEDRGAQFDNDCARDSASLALRSLTDPKLLDTSIKLFSEVISHPIFPEKALDRRKKNIVAAIKQQLQTPGYVAARAFYKNLYHNHPYAHPVLGTLKSIPPITQKDVVNFYNQYYVGNNAVVAIVGDVTLDQAKKIADEVIGGLPEGKKAPSLPKAQDLQKAETKQITFPSTQTHIIIGQVGISRQSPEIYALSVGNFILGGNPFISRLFKVVREEHAFAYAVYSYFLPMEDDGPFVISLQTKTDQTQSALKLTNETFLNYIKNGPTEKELTLAKNGIIGGFPLTIDSNSAIAGKIATIGFYNLPLNYLDTYRDKIKAVTQEDIKKAFHQLIHPNHMLTITVGKANSNAKA